MTTGLRPTAPASRGSDAAAPDDPGTRLFAAVTGITGATLTDVRADDHRIRLWARGRRSAAAEPPGGTGAECGGAGWVSERFVGPTLGGRSTTVTVRHPVGVGDGTARCDPPEGTNRAAGLTREGMVSFLHHAARASTNEAAARHRLERGVAGRVFATFVARYLEPYRPRLPAIVGLDVTHLGPNYLSVCGLVPTGDGAGNHVTTALPYAGRLHADLVARLRALDGAAEVRVVVIDGSAALRALAREAFPQADIALDGRHVIRRLQKHQATGRNRMPTPPPKSCAVVTAQGRRRQTTKYVLDKPPARLSAAQRRVLARLRRDPALDAQYRLLQRLRGVFRCRNEAAARRGIAAVVTACTRPKAPRPLRRFAAFLAGWTEAIVATVRHRVSTQYVERRMQDVKRLNRLSSGHAPLDHLVVRLLIACGGPDRPPERLVADRVLATFGTDGAP